MYDSIDKTAHKLIPMLLLPEDDSGRGIMIIDETTQAITNIMDESLILKALATPIRINRIYADKYIKDEVIEEIKDMEKY